MVLNLKGIACYLALIKSHAMNLPKESSFKLSSRSITKVLVELAELHLESPETSKFISTSGLEKVRRKLATS